MLGIWNWGLSGVQDGTNAFPRGVYDLVREKDGTLTMKYIILVSELCKWYEREGSDVIEAYSYNSVPG